jgi:hypothetical protein
VVAKSFGTAVPRLMNKRRKGGATMLSKSKLVLASAVIITLGAVSPSLAQNSGAPTIDIQKTCRESSSALIGLTGSDSQDTFSSCMNDEQTARDQLVKDWATYPAPAKALCIQPKEYLPGYVEWQSCLEMTRDGDKFAERAGGLRACQFGCQPPIIWSSIRF